MFTQLLFKKKDRMINNGVAMYLSNFDPIFSKNDIEGITIPSQLRAQVQGHDAEVSDSLQ
jgi:hypothetical protein